MKKSFFNLLLVISLILTGIINVYPQQLLLMMDDDIQNEANQYIKRVNIDDGTINNKNLLNKFISNAKKDNWYQDILFWTSAQWGLKESGQNISRQYDLLGKDLTTDGFDKRPTKISTESFTGVKYDGDNDYSYNSNVKAENAVSVLLVFKYEGNDESILLSSEGNKKFSVGIENKEGNDKLVIRTAGEISIDGLRKGLNFVLAEFNFKESKVYINGELKYNGVIGKSEIDGLVVGRGQIKNSTKHFKGVVYETGILKGILSDSARNNLNNMIKDNYLVK